MSPEEINYINAHGTGTKMNDSTETLAVKKAFGEHAKNIAINSTKSMTGHLLGAAGGVEAVVTALSVKNGKIHRTLGYSVPDPECDLDYVTEGTRELNHRSAQQLSRLWRTQRLHLHAPHRRLKGSAT